MKQPMDPHNLDNPGESEYSWGTGMFPPGVAANEAQRRPQDNFGDNMVPPQLDRGDTHQDNYARQVADRRTDTTDPNSNRDFDELGNVDRYGANPPLIRAKPVRNVSQRQDPPRNTTPRKW